MTLPRCASLAFTALLLAPLASAQTVRSSQRLPVGGQPDIGQIADKPDGSGLYFVDPNQGGQAGEVRILGLSWGRLVDVHELARDLSVDPRPVFTDMVINENVLSDGVDYLLETNPITLRTRLVILRRRGTDLGTGRGTFYALLDQARQGLVPVLPKGCNDPPPFSFMPRNGTLVLHLDDLLEDDATAAQELFETVRVATGYPPSVPYSARVVFDPNYGGVAGGAFHSTRVLVDMAISELEAATLPVPINANAIGLPSSRVGTPNPNVKLRIPTRLDPASGQFALLTNLSGAPLATTGNGPVEPNSPTLDVVRAMRSGNEQDINGGFLLDLQPPELLSNWSASVDAARQDPGGRRGVQFLIDLRFLSGCRAAPAAGDTLQLGGIVAEVTGAAAAYAPSTGVASDLPVTVLVPDEVASAALLGAGLVHTPYTAAAPVDPACWITIRPGPATPPATGVDPSSQFTARFSEPLDLGTVSAFDSLRIVRGDASVVPDATSLVVAAVGATSLDFDEFALNPTLPLAHSQGTAETYHVEILDSVDESGGDENTGIADLAGNSLTIAPGPIEFTLDPQAPSETNMGIALRFADPDEYRDGTAGGAPDVRGQVFYDLFRGVLVPRPVSFFSEPADRSQPVPSIMIPFPPGTQNPLNPLGAKVQSVWRYADLGWAVEDESFHNVDVEGLAWSPAGGLVISDFFDRFEMLLSHGEQLPDENIEVTLLPRYPDSGLADGLFQENILEDPESPQKLVHPRLLGYRVDPADRFVSMTGTPLMPYPMNRGAGPDVTYTWRDTAVLAQGGDGGAGIPMDIEVGQPLNVAPFPPGALAPPGEVPSIGLPLLVEIRCYPSTTALGLNPLDVSLAINSSSRPNFRAYSAGGIGVGGQVVPKNPDLELSPSGGFNPSSSPPGRPTRYPVDNIWHVGQIDFVIRVSRAHTVFFDTGFSAPQSGPGTLEWDRGGSTNTFVQVDLRGATGFSVVALQMNSPFDARLIDPYGEPDGDPFRPGAMYPNGDPSWSSSILGGSGTRYVQARLSFINDTVLRVAPNLDSLGLVFVETGAAPLTRSAKRRAR